MAERRMFAKTIIDSDVFLDMPLSTQALYFHLSMRADDDGFINNPKKIQRMIGCGDDDLKLLIAKKFLILFESGVIVIKHWRIHNYIQKDRYKETVYTDEKSLLYLKENKAYTLCPPTDTECIQNGDDKKTEDNSEISKIESLEPCIQDVYSLETQDRDRLDKSKDSLGKDNIDKDNSSSVVVHGNIEIFKHFEKCGFIVTGQLMEFIAADKEIYSAQWLIDAANECVKRGKLNNYGYLTGILQNWKTEGRENKANTTKQSNKDPKPLRFNNFEAREYDYDDLENKLLGWDKD